MESDDATPMDVEGDAGDSPCPSAQALEEEEKIKLESKLNMVPISWASGATFLFYVTLETPLCLFRSDPCISSSKNCR